MRLLNINDHSFREFFGENIPPYIITSHRWSDDETTYKDVLKRRNTQSKGWRKIEGFCERVTRDNALLKTFENATCCEWIWIDTCCIDSRSSAEVSESINSMFQWYMQAQECHAYMADVRSMPMGGETADVLDDFRKSEWFKRGWTLQELLAPRCVIFFTKTWEVIGHKCAHCKTTHGCEGAGPLLNGIIAEVTGIPEDVLREYDRSQSFGVEQKMKWQYGRKTTRPEDQAYCLLGIFDVHMPLLYGEGKKAMLRLERTIFDERERPWQSQLTLDFFRNMDAGTGSFHRASTKRFGRPLAIMRFSDIEGEVSCVCGYDDDDGYTVACDSCQRWQHQLCYFPEYVDRDLPSDLQHLCVGCSPRALDQSSARARQRAKRGRDTQTGSTATVPGAGNVSPVVGQKRKASEQRAAIETRHQPTPRREPLVGAEPPFGHIFPHEFSDHQLDFAPSDQSDVLDNFDFGSFLNTASAGSGMGLDADFTFMPTGTVVDSGDIKHQDYILPEHGPTYVDIQSGSSILQVSPTHPPSGPQSDTTRYGDYTLHDRNAQGAEGAQGHAARESSVPVPLQPPAISTVSRSQHGWPPYISHSLPSIAEAPVQLSDYDRTSLEQDFDTGSCPIASCGRRVKDLKAHMLTHQQDRPHKCPITACEYHTKGFARVYDQNRHALTHYKGTMTCNFCHAHKSFNRADVFKRHLTSVHGVEQRPPNARRSAPTHVTQTIAGASGAAACSTCNQIFASPQDFYEHLDDCVLAAVAPGEQMDYTCTYPECTSAGVNFARYADLQRHVAAIHGRASLVLIDCMFPGCHRKGEYGFMRKDKMVEHMREVHKADIPRRSR